MTILVVGGGAVGSFIATTLVTGGNDVTLLRRGETPGLSRESFTVVGPASESHVVELDVAGAPEAVSQVPGIVVLAVKMPDLPGAIEAAARWPDAAVLAVQNGVGADALLESTRTSGGIVAGSLTAAIELDRESATIRRLSAGGIGLAPVRGDVAGVLEELAAGFQAGGLRPRRVSDPVSMRWSKLLANLLANATSAIVDLDSADVYRDRGLFAIERRQLREALAVIHRLGVRLVSLPGADTRPLRLAGRLPAGLVQPVMLRLVAAGRGGKTPSLRRHLLSGGGPSEVDWLNGAVASAALEMNRRAPINARLAELVGECSADPARWAWFRGRPDRLITELEAL